MPSSLPEQSISVTLVIRSLVLVVTNLPNCKKKKNTNERNTPTMTVLRATKETLGVTVELMRGTDEKQCGSVFLHEYKKRIRQSWFWTHLRERRETCYVPGLSLGPFSFTTILEG